jgi:hypothetical protein
MASRPVIGQPRRDRRDLGRALRRQAALALGHVLALLIAGAVGVGPPARPARQGHVAADEFAFQRRRLLGVNADAAGRPAPLRRSVLDGAGPCEGPDDPDVEGDQDD